VPTTEWIASIPAGRTPYAAVLLEGQVAPAQPFTMAVIHIASDHRR
jgi:hypothetical protein